MGNKLALILFLVFYTNILIAKPVDTILAKKVAYNFLIKQTNAYKNIKDKLIVDLVYTWKENSPFGENGLNRPLFYIYNVNKSIGFVIVSADDIALPVLGYSTEQGFTIDKMPINLKAWLIGYQNEIKFGITNKLIPDKTTMDLWNLYLNDSLTSTSYQKKGSAIVGPLVKTKWDQSPYYNDLCPYDYQYNEKTVTGCVATAMAQIIKYWNYPITGSGFHSYNHSTYGTLSANFGGTNYDWNNMPTQLNRNSTPQQVNAVATLMYHCGVSVDMNYGVSSSGAQTLDCVNAYKQYFNYSNNTNGLYRSKYTTQNWINLLKNELNNNRPIHYAGIGSGGGHSFVCDGYDNVDFFHFNWGWSGNSDGYFSIDALNPGSLGTGGGNGGFNKNQRAIIGIEPAITQMNDMRMYDTISPSTQKVFYNSTFSVTTNFANYSSFPFNGDYCAAAFDDSGNFVDYIQILSSYTLNGNSHYTNDLTFKTSGLPSLVPGHYKIGFYFRPSGGNWQPFKDNPSLGYYNFAEINIYNQNRITLYKPITTTPTTLVKGSLAGISLNVINKGSTTFFGKYGVALMNLDGSIAQWMDTSLNEINGLQTNYVYTNNLNFSCPVVNVNAGTYYLMAWYKRSINNTWFIMGTDSFINPIKVIVKESSLKADKYEVNDSVPIAYNFNMPVFTNDSTDIIIDSANFHIGSDYDFYKTIFPRGRKYNVTLRASSNKYSFDTTNYTASLIYALSDDGNNLIGIFTDSLVNSTFYGGSNFYLAVVPEFSGLMGTYKIQVSIKRSSLPKTTRVYSNCDSLIFRGKKYFNSTSVFDTLLSANGYDSAIRENKIIILKVSKITNTQNLVGCNSVSYKNKTYTSSTVVRDTLRTVQGCDSVYNVTNITITPTGISGMIRTAKNNTTFIKGVTLQLSGTQNQTVLVDSGYKFTCLGNLANGTIRLTKNNDKNRTNGINTIDIALVQSHILQKAILNSPYKIIAADVNDDKKVTSLDIVFMKRMILGIDTMFPKKRLWAFVDSSYNFSTPTNPFPYKDSISFTGLNANQTNQTFIGMKLGDVNWDWNANLPKGLTLPTVELSYEFKVEGSKVKVPVYIKNFKAMQGIQYSINFNSKALKFLGITNKAIPFEFNTNQANEGKISMLWIDSKNEIKTLVDGTLVFELEFETATNAPMNAELINSLTHQPIIQLSNDITEVLAIDGDLNRYNVVLKSANINTPPITISNIFSIYPNPAKDKLIISTDAKQAQISISNELGKQFIQQKVVGQTTIDVSKLAKGVYFISLISDKGVSTQTFIKE